MATSSRSPHGIDCTVKGLFDTDSKDVDPLQTEKCIKNNREKKERKKERKKEIYKNKTHHHQLPGAEVQFWSRCTPEVEAS